MCQKKGCTISSCGCCSKCNCEVSCYDCWDVRRQPFSCTTREFHASADIRHKFVCFPCRRVWKSYTSKYILQQLYSSNDVTPADFVPNICKPELSTKEKKKQREKYQLSRGWTDWGAKFVNESGKLLGNQHPKCAKCGKEAVSVGRNFRHCKTEKQWLALEEKVKNGEIDLQKDFRNYPREGSSITPL